MNRLEVWVADLSGFGEITHEHLNWIAPHEEAHAQRLAPAYERKKYLLSRILLRRALSAVLGGEPEKWNFITGKTGKVSLAHFHGLPLADFSISHSKNAIVLAISSAGRVGLDIEQLDPVVFRDLSLREALSSSLVERELRYLESRSPETRWQQALQIWTIKQAYSKLLGLGNHVDFTEFEVLPAPWRIVHRKGPGGAIHLETHEVAIGSQNYQMALTARPSERDIPFAQVRVVDCHNLMLLRDGHEIPQAIKAQAVPGKITTGLTSVSWLYSPKVQQRAKA